MEKIIIQMNDRAKGAKALTQILTKYDFDADIKCGRYMVDAKSMLGVLCLPASEQMELLVHTDNVQPVVEQLSQLQMCV